MLMPLTSSRLPVGGIPQRALVRALDREADHDLVRLRDQIVNGARAMPAIRRYTWGMVSNRCSAGSNACSRSGIWRGAGFQANLKIRSRDRPGDERVSHQRYSGLADPPSGVEDDLVVLARRRCGGTNLSARLLAELDQVALGGHRLGVLFGVPEGNGQVLTRLSISQKIDP